MENEKLFRKLQFYSIMKAKYESEYNMLQENKYDGFIDETIDRDLKQLEKRICTCERRIAKITKKLSKSVKQ